MHKKEDKSISPAQAGRLASPWAGYSSWPARSSFGMSRINAQNGNSRKAALKAITSL